MKRQKWQPCIKIKGKSEALCSINGDDFDIMWFKKNFVNVFGIKDICKYMLIKDGYSFENDEEFENLVKEINDCEWRNIFCRYIKVFKKAKIGHRSKYGEWFLRELISNGVIESKGIYERIENVNNKILAIKNGIDVSSDSVVVYIDGKFYKSLAEFSKLNNIPNGRVGARRRRTGSYTDEEIFDTNNNFFNKCGSKKVFYNEKWYNSRKELLEEYGINKKSFDAKRKRLRLKYGTSFTITEVLDEILKNKKDEEEKYVVNDVNYLTIENLCKSFELKEENVKSQKHRLQKKFNKPITFEETVNYILEKRNKNFDGCKKTVTINGVRYEKVKECLMALNITKSEYTSCRAKLKREHNKVFTPEETINYMLENRSKKLQKNS